MVLLPGCGGSVTSRLCRNKCLQIAGASPLEAQLAQSLCKAIPFTLASGPHLLTKEKQTTTFMFSSLVNSLQLRHVPIWLCLGSWK